MGGPAVRGPGLHLEYSRFYAKMARNLHGRYYKLFIFIGLLRATVHIIILILIIVRVTPRHLLVQEMFPRKPIRVARVAPVVVVARAVLLVRAMPFPILVCAVAVFVI